MVAGPYSFAAWSEADMSKFQELYDMALAKVDAANSDVKIVGDFDEMKALMVQHGAAEKRTLPPHVVGICSDNRDAKIMNAMEMCTKGCKIVSVGASRDLCGPLRAWCVEDTEGRLYYLWTLKTANTSEQFARPSEWIEYGSIGCSHWNQFLQAVNQCRPTKVQSLADDKGNIDKDRIFKRDPVFRSLATIGMDWYVIRRGFVVRFPQVPRIFSKALNAEHNIAVGETWDQQLASVYATAQNTSGDKVDWTSVRSQIAVSQGPCVPDLATHINFVRRYGGFPTMSQLRELLDFFNLRLPAGRQVSGSWIDKLQQVPMTTEFSIPNLVVAVFKAHACCDNFYCENGLARYVTVAEIKALSTRNKGLALEAEGILSNLKKVFAESAGSKTLEYGRVSIEIAEVILGKQKKKTCKDCSLTYRHNYVCSLTRYN